MSQQPQELLAFADYSIDVGQRVLLLRGTPVPLSPKVFDTLLALAEEPGRVLEKDYLLEKIWPDTFVEEGSLAQNVSTLRRVLGRSEDQEYIETIPRRGYRFKGAVQRVSGTCATPTGSDHLPDDVSSGDGRKPEGDAASTDGERRDSAGTNTGSGDGAEALWEASSRPVSRSGTNPTIRTLKRRKWLIAVVGLAALAVISTRLPSLVGARPAAVESIQSLAVLPFVNRAGDAELEYLSDGMTDRVIDRLSRVSGLRVMSHNAVFHYKGRVFDAAAIGRELGVQAVLNGSLVKHRDGVRLNLELVDARDNSHLWGEQYDRGVHDLLALEREIPVDVSDKLRLTLSADSKRRLTQPYTDNAEAYQLYLKGRYAWEKWTSDGSKQAIAYFEEAIRKDPEYALAHAGLADAYVFGTEAGGGLPRDEAHKRGKAAAIKALALDPQLAEAHAALGVVLLYIDWDFPGAHRAFRQALSLNPSYAEAHHQYSHLLLLLGRIEESLSESQKFLELDPVSESPIGHLGWHYLSAREYDKSIAWSQKDLQLHPEAPQPTLFDAYYGAGMFAEAAEQFVKESGRRLTAHEISTLRASFAKAGIRGFLRTRIQQMERLPADRDLVDIAAFHARLDERDAAFKYLEMAYVKHAPGLVRLKEDVRFDTVRPDPRFADLLRRIGLPL